MSRTISEFFKPKLEPESDSDKAAVKHEEEGDFDINLDEIKKEIKIDENSPKIRECRVVLKDCRKEKGTKFKAKSTKMQKFTCNFCGKIISGKNNLMTHMKNIHSNEMKNLINCEICGENFLKKLKFENHMEAKHFNRKIEYFECDFDGKIFATKTKLLKHMGSHQMTIKCEICLAEVKPYSMNGHKESAHSTGQKFQCKICSKYFKTIRSLNIHEKTHNKKFNCEICNKNFSMLCYLNKHKKESHESPKSFECEICGKKWNEKGNLRKHKKTHDKNRPRPFKCQRCDYATDLQASYKKHQKSHELQDKKFAAMKNPLKCEKCSTFCSNKRALRMHMKQVHPKKLFQCDLCGKYSKTLKDLKRHLKIHQKSALKEHIYTK